MTPEPSGSTRRSLLQAGGVTLATTAAGCLSVLDGVDGSRGEWPMWYGDAGHSRRASPGPFESPLAKEDVAWDYPDGSPSEVTTFPIVSGDSLFVGVEGDESEVHAVDAHSGERRWRRSLKPSTRIGQAVHREVFVTAVEDADGDRVLYGLDATDGSTLWTVSDPPWPVVLVHGGRAYVSIEEGSSWSFVALDIETGDRRWTYPDAGGSIPAIAGDSVILPGSSGELHALDAETGDLQWRRDLGSSPVFSSDGDRLYVTTESEDGGSEATALVTGDGSTDWTTKLMGGSNVSQPIIGDDRLVFGAPNHLWGLDSTTGEVRWTRGIWENLRGYGLLQDPILAGDVLLQVTGGGDDQTPVPSGRLEGIDVTDGSELWTIDEVLTEDSWFSTCLAHDTLYVRNEGRIRAIRPSE